MIERPKTGNQVILVHVSLQGCPDQEALCEIREIAHSAGAHICDLITAQRHTPDQRTYVGAGKADEIAEQVAQHAADLVIFNHTLTPSQERNLEKCLCCRVIDRTGLILDIFAQRARSHEGKLQVELAQLQHLSTRLVRGWTHLERQKGGIGLRGPGETQLETDRRLLGQRITQIRKRLQRVENQRNQSRQARRKATLATIALVGYTNAGKSTLFNQLTQAQVTARNQLFATLDPTLRRIRLPNNQTCILADTVGFISNLPHTLVAAFKSTLQEVIEADLLLHIVDAANPNHADQMADVEAVLNNIGAEKIPQLVVYNKIDCLAEQPPSDRKDASGQVTAIWLSAVTGTGINHLQHALQKRLAKQQIRGSMQLGPSEGRLRAQLYQTGHIEQETITDNGGWDILITLSQQDYARLQKQTTMPKLR
jgi:GTP-binding protein HflX